MENSKQKNCKENKYIYNTYITKKVIINELASS